MIHAILTIDDVPSKNTPAIVDYLEEKGIRPILFAVGENLERRPEEALYALRRGMIVGNHTFSHPHVSELSPEEAIEDIERCEALLDALYGEAGVPRLYRPFRFPFGDKGGRSHDALQAFLKRRGLDKVREAEIGYPCCREQGLDRDIDTF